jgi:hypothetical protein
MAVNGDPTPVVFEWENERSQIAIVSRVLWDILGSAPTSTKFGGIAGGLTNGILIELVDAADVVQFNFFDGEPIRQNHEFGCLAGVDWDITAGQGLDALSIRWSLFKSGKELRVLPGFKLRIVVQDDLTPLGNMVTLVQGYYLT